ncbi:MAG: type II toxin-antitoxin system ParD family antitoxin [bacterium]|nr:type II toxin-antitoxin system ParD family antitoxin [bacterium]
MRHEDRAITMNISLPASPKHFVDAQVADGGNGSASEYMREVIRGAKRRLARHEQLERLLLQGLLSGPAKE